MVASNMDFSSALKFVKNGSRATRDGWNGKGMFIFLVQGSRFEVNREPMASVFGMGASVNYHGHIDMMTAQGYVVPWVASHADLLSQDWRLVETPE